MRVAEICSKYFLFLVTFRRRAGHAAMSERWVRNRLREILEQAEGEARKDARLHRQFDRARYALVALADEIILDSSWEFRERWAADLFEAECFGTAIAGEEFFTRMEQDLGDSELAEIYYQCLGLGFLGKYRARPDELRELRYSLYARLPDRPKESDRVSPDAYEHTDEQELRVIPLIRSMKFAIICLALAVFFAFLGNSIYENNVNKLDVESASADGDQ